MLVVCIHGVEGFVPHSLRLNHHLGCLAERILFEWHHLDLVFALLGVPDQDKLARVEYKVFKDGVNPTDLIEKVNEKDSQLLHIDQLALLIFVHLHVIECAHKAFI